MAKRNQAEALFAAVERAQQAAVAAEGDLRPDELQRLRVKLSVCAQIVRAALDGPAPAPTAPAPAGPAETTKGENA